jgi:predicted membrane protein
MDNMEQEDRGRNHHEGRVWAALILIAVGSVLVLRQMGLALPYWLFSWPMILIVIGLFIGFRHGFRGGGWIIMILIGSFFLMDDFVPEFSLHRYVWPFIIIFIGIMILLRPGRNSRWQRRAERKGYGNWGSEEWRKNWRRGWHRAGQEEKYKQKYANYSSQDFIDATTVFGGIHKTIVSKDFKGGDITIFMGGSEINMAQADINGTVVIDITQIMGGTKLIVPAHWEIRSNITSVFGNVEDKRQQDRVTNPEKILIIDGTSVFGGIEIKNY